MHNSSSVGTVLKCDHIGNFTIVGNSLFTSDLTGDAVKVLTYLLSKPEDWIPRRSDVQNMCQLSWYKTKEVWKQLIKKGYLAYKRIKDHNGRFTGCRYYVYESPDLNPDHSTGDRCNQQLSLFLPHVDLPSCENSPQLENTDQTNINKAEFRFNSDEDTDKTGQVIQSKDQRSGDRVNDRTRPKRSDQTTDQAIAKETIKPSIPTMVKTDQQKRSVKDRSSAAAANDFLKFVIDHVVMKYPRVPETDQDKLNVANSLIRNDAKTFGGSGSLYERYKEHVAKVAENQRIWAQAKQAEQVDDEANAIAWANLPGTTPWEKLRHQLDQIKKRSL